MKTILTKEKNGTTIIVGYSVPVINAVETEKKIKPMLNNSNIKELIKKHAVYFEPKKGEKIITEEKYEEYVSTEIPEHGLLSIDNKIVLDYSEQEIWQNNSGKWGKIELNIGENIPYGAILAKNLTEEQRNEIAEQKEENRIAELSQEEAEAEKQKIIDGLLAQAVVMRSGLEIKGDKDALQKSTQWYDEQVAIIETKYSRE